MQSAIRTATVIMAVWAVGGSLPAPVQGLLYATLQGLLYATANAQGAPHGGPPVVGVGEVRSGPVTSTSEFVGRVQAVDSVALVARVTAFLDQRLFTEGSDVKKGQVLYVLERGPFQAQLLAQQGNLAQAQANVANASVNFQRQKALLNTPAGQRQSFDNALATARSNAGGVLTAQGNLQLAQINLDYTEIRSPIDGRITATAVNEGNVVSPTSGTLATIVSQDPMYIVFPVATRDVVSLQKKYADAGGLGAAKIGLRLTDGDSYDQNATLDYVSPSVSANTDTVTLRARVANPQREGGDKGGVSSRQLVDGAFVTVLISDPHPVVSPLVPRAAVLADQQGSYVYAVDAQNHAIRANIKLGDAVGADQAVLSGLSAGQRIVVDGLQRIHPGAAITPAAPEPAISDAPSPPPGTPPNRQ